MRLYALSRSSWFKLEQVKETYTVRLRSASPLFHRGDMALSLRRIFFDLSLVGVGGGGRLTTES